jgi:predicted ABC-type ATPase
MIAGPNGSGKSTLLEYLSGLAAAEHFPLGFVQNPDALEREIDTAQRLYLGTWGVHTSDAEFSGFVRAHPLFSRIQTNIPSVIGDALVFDGVDSLGYLIPILCDFFRQLWIASGESFTFETVMSGRDKLDVLQRCKRQRYRTYLYYICTDDVSINEARIANRVAQGGHPVPRDKVAGRYQRSLGLLADAIKAVDRAYIFDNSGMQHRLIATFESGRAKQIYGALQPRWFVEGALAHLGKTVSRRRV